MHYVHRVQCTENDLTWKNPTSPIRCNWQATETSDSPQVSHSLAGRIAGHEDEHYFAKNEAYLAQQAKEDAQAERELNTAIAVVLMPPGVCK